MNGVARIPRSVLLLIAAAVVGGLLKYLEPRIRAFTTETAPDDLAAPIERFAPVSNQASED